MKLKLLIAFIMFIVCLSLPIKQTLSITNNETGTTYTIPVAKGDTITTISPKTKEQLSVQKDYLLAQNPERQIDKLILFIGQNQKILSNNADIDLQKLGETGNAITIELKNSSFIEILKTLIILTF